MTTKETKEYTCWFYEKVYRNSICLWNKKLSLKAIKEYIEKYSLIVDIDDWHDNEDKDSLLIEGKEYYLRVLDSNCKEVFYNI